MSLIIYLIIILSNHCWLMHFIFFFNASKMIVPSPSENGQVLRVIPSTQTGMAQVIIPQGQLVDVNSPQGK